MTIDDDTSCRTTTFNGRWYYIMSLYLWYDFVSILIYHWHRRWCRKESLGARAYLAPRRETFDFARIYRWFFTYKISGQSRRRKADQQMLQCRFIGALYNIDAAFISYSKVNNTTFIEIKRAISFLRAAWFRARFLDYHHFATEPRDTLISYAATATYLH